LPGYELKKKLKKANSALNELVMDKKKNISSIITGQILTVKNNTISYYPNALNSSNGSSVLVIDKGNHKKLDVFKETFSSN
jgi:hypothetical protein